jgi:[acyl-carrier-protein] S-malonyltransferase
LPTRCASCAAAGDTCTDAAQGEVVSAANLNGGGQVVIGGAREAVKRAGERAKALGARRVIPLNVSAPFHTALMKPAETQLAPELRALTTTDPRVPIVANVDAHLKRSAEEAIDALIRQIASPVKWQAVVERLALEGVTTYVEVGPGSVLSGLVRKIHRDATTVSFAGPDDLAAVETIAKSQIAKSPIAHD